MFVMYPVPANDFLNVKISHGKIAQMDQVTFTISDVSGSVVKTVTSFSDGNGNYPIDLSGLGKGMYFVIFEKNEIAYKKAFIKQ